MSEKYGELSSEKLAEEKLFCRKILEEINRVGITQRQKLFLMYIMSLELEDVQARNDLAIVTKDFLERLGGTFEKSDND